MKFKQIVLFFVIALPVSLALRFVQLFHIVEAETGFYKPGYGNWGGAVTAIILGVVLVIAVFAAFTHRSPKEPPKVKLGMGLASGVLAFVVAIELMIGSNTFGSIAWQRTMLYISGIAVVVWLVAYAIKDFMNIKLPPLTALVPCFFFIFKMICNFAGISSLALISDNVLLTAAYCVVLLFMLQFAKTYNGVDSKYGSRKLLAYGMASSLLCFVQSVPNIIFHLSSEQGYEHTALVTSFSLLFTGVFIIVFVFSHFSRKNTCKENV